MEGRGLSGEDDTQVKETEERTVTEVLFDAAVKRMSGYIKNKLIILNIFLQGPTEPENDGSGPQPHRGLSGVEQNSAAATDYGQCGQYKYL